MSARTTRQLGRIFIMTSMLSLFACGGGGGGSSSGDSTGGSGSGGGASGSGSSGGNAVAAAQLGPSLGQALLGPIVDATVEVYQAENFDGVSICTVMTSAEAAPEGPGVIDLSSCPVTADSVYFLVVEGGWDIDADDDGVIDATRTAKQGSLRAIMSGQQILDGDFRINIVTEIAFQSVADALLGGVSQLEILSRLNAVARQLLADDLNGDGVVDNEDLLDFSPIDDESFIAGDYGQQLEDILAAIMSGNTNELTKLSRELLLASLGEYDFAELVSGEGEVENLLIHDFIVEDGFIYAAGYDIASLENDLKIFVFDATDFSSVSLVGAYANENLAVKPEGVELDLLKVGDVLYVASQGNGLFVIDVTDPAGPAASLLLEGSYFTHLALGDDSTVYMSYDDELSVSYRGIDIVDITEPLNPEIVGSVNGVTVFDMLYAEGMLYVYGPGIAVYDASSSTSLSFVNTISFPADSNSSIAYHNGFVYSPITDIDADLQGLTIIDVRDPGNLQRIDDIAGIGYVTEVDIYDLTLYATASTNSGSSFVLISFGIGDDGKLQMIDSRSSPIARYLHYEDGRVYLASAIQLTAYDANALSKNVDHLGFLATNKTANLVEVVGSIAYVANDSELLAVDVSNPAGALPILDDVDVIDRIKDMAIAGNYAYLANATEGIKIVDISDPGNLQVIGSNDELVPFYDSDNDIMISREMSAIAMQDDLAYTLVGGFPYTSIGVFAIGDPAAPTVEYSPEFASPIDDIVVRNDTLYGVDRWAGSATLYVVDVANEPALVTTIELPSRAIEIDGAYIYTTSGTAGLSILDVSDPRSPVLFGSTLSLGIGNAISVLGETAYVANDFGAVEVYDILDRTRPVLWGHYPISGTVKDVFASADYIYAVNGYGLVIEPAATLHSALE